MSIPTTARRLVAGSAALALAGGALAVVAASSPAQAAVAPVLNWEISQQFDDHLSTHTLGDGATEDADGVVSFAGGVGSYNAANGAATISYQGSVTGAFVNAGTEFYSVTIEDPTVVVDGDGKGTVSAVVSAANAAAMGNPAAATTPERVVVTTFTVADGWTAESFAATPDWAGVLPADSERATGLGIGAGKPVDGKSFAPTFLDQLTSGVRAHFYASGSGSDPKKAPAAFAATANPIATTATVSGASYAAGLTVAVTGSGFSAVTNPGDAGVYVGIAPAGGLPDVSSQAGMSSFVASDWVMPNRIAADAFTSVITAETAKLDPTKTYSVYTWRAHTHSTVSQDTETPLTIDWAALAKPATPTATPTPTPTATPTPTPTPTATPTPTPTATAPARTTTNVKVTKAPTSAKGGKLVVKITGADGIDGKAVVVVKAKGKPTKAGKKIKRDATVVDGKAVVKLPKLATGAYKVTVRFLGADDLEASKAVKAFRVKK